MMQLRSYTPEIVADSSSGWIEPLARAGYAAKGVVYLLVGIFAGQAALGSGDTEGSTGALRTLTDEPLGQVFLGIMALGLFGYVVWRLLAAFRNPEDKGTGTRVFYVISAAVYGVLGVEAARFALSGGPEAGGGGDHWTSAMASQPYAMLLIGAGGAVLAAYGLYRLYQAWVVDLDDRLDLSAFSPGSARAIIWFGRLGYAARGAVFTLMGGLAVRAALASRPEEAQPMSGILEDLESHPWILAAIGAGFVAYALYTLVRAGYRRIDTRESSSVGDPQAT